MTPQGVPSVAFDRPVQTELPVEHDVVPFLQGLSGGLQAVPPAQATHCPPEHTSFVPHAVPSLATVPMSLHIATPPEHEMAPTWHGLAAGEQAAPSEHGAHPPSLQ